MSAQPQRAACVHRTPALAELASVRVTGTLTEPARIGTSSGAHPVAFLQLAFRPPHGLPYVARLCLGTDLADRLDAEACLPHLRTDALVSVAGEALELRTDHEHAALRVVGARDLFIPIGAPISATTTEA